MTTMVMAHMSTGASMNLETYTVMEVVTSLEPT